MSTDVPWEAWFHKEHADANRLLTENYLLRQRIEALEIALARVIRAKKT